MRFPGRTFQVLEYRVRQKQLLVRAAKSEQHPKNVDILFSGVEYLELPTTLGEVQLVPPFVSDLSRLQTVFRPDVDSRHVNVFLQGERHYLVVAVDTKVTENDLDAHDSGLR
ncbi:hypothetical protein LZ198_04575 [Myxococcus sp. K15C18031901]|uniref:hypothetical protein n=1 Tax=Myxococcus dinghuensis TaxID=2906761 RepID=UPI0020A7C13D|nr:hypothetical protein [Myxococcus dinghuensis]MCP3098151.1 hypothetical protein [Myxococcus dinghuensis]